MTAGASSDGADVEHAPPFTEKNGVKKKEKEMPRPNCGEHADVWRTTQSNHVS